MREAVDIVVGGGVTGLTAASELSRRNRDVILLEKAPDTGGMCRSFIMDEVVFDIGPHMLMLNPHRKCGRFIRRLLKNERMLRNRYRFTIEGSRRYWQIPVTISEFTRYPVNLKKTVLFSALNRLFRSSSCSSAAVYIIRRFGIEQYNSVFEPLIRKKLGLTGCELHRNWLLRPVKTVYSASEFSPFADRGVSFIELSGKLMHEANPFYCYPSGGIHTIPLLLRRNFERNGGKVITECGKIELVSDHERIYEARLATKCFKIKNLIWTAPVRELYDAVGENLPEPVQIVNEILVFATFDAGSISPRPYLHTYHPGDNTVFNRVYYPRSIFGENSPAGREGFCFEIRLSREVGLMSEKELLRKTLEGAERTGIADPEALREHCQIVLQEAFPLFALDYLERERNLFSIVNRFKNLFCAGRKGNFHNCMVPGAVNQGLMAADRIFNERTQ